MKVVENMTTKDWQKYLIKKDNWWIERIEKIKDRIRKLPNRDDKIQRFQKIHFMTLDGGGVGRFEVIKIIDEETA